MSQTSRNSKIIKASPEKIFSALMDPHALEIFQAPADMTAKVHSFDGRVGGGYSMSLFYPDNETKFQGKTSSNEDKFSARFTEIIPGQKIVQAILFDTESENLKDEMIMETHLEALSDGTNVIMIFKNIPEGVDPKDNEEGTASTLEKLADYVESPND